VETSNDMYASIDGAVDKIRKQISRSRERVKDHKG
jgi:ribosomal subunit interface protein